MALRVAHESEGVERIRRVAVQRFIRMRRGSGHGNERAARDGHAIREGVIRHGFARHADRSQSVEALRLFEEAVDLEHFRGCDFG